MYTDAGLSFGDAKDMSGDLANSLSIDLSPLSPDLGAGNEVYILVNVNTYTAGSSVGTTMDVVTSAVTGLTSHRLITTTGLIVAASMEAIDDTAVGYQPIVIKIPPEHILAVPGVYDPGGVAESFIGMIFTHDTQAPTTLTITSSLVVNYQGRHHHHTSGIVIA